MEPEPCMLGFVKVAYELTGQLRALMEKIARSYFLE